MAIIRNAETIEAAKTLLRSYYERNGCIRFRQDLPEKGRLGGVELRFIVGNMNERREVSNALKVLSIPHGRVYRKQPTRRQWVVPLYTRVNIVRLLQLVQPENHENMLQRIQEIIKRKSKSESKLLDQN